MDYDGLGCYSPDTFAGHKPGHLVLFCASSASLPVGEICVGVTVLPIAPISATSLLMVHSLLVLGKLKQV